MFLSMNVIFLNENCLHAILISTMLRITYFALYIDIIEVVNQHVTIHNETIKKDSKS